MLEHHIQRDIVRRLSQANGLRFSELKPDGLENKLFDYHLKITLRDGLVEKTDEGLYQLTPEGQRMGTRVFSDPHTIADSAYSVLFLVICRSSDGAWLLYKRNLHPIKDRIGFMHAQPTAGMSVIEAAAEQCRDKTGLSCEFSVLGGGFIRTYSGDELQSFVNFSLLYCDDASGELVQHDDAAEYFWELEPDFAASTMIPNMTLLHELYEKKRPFFVDETLQL